MRRYASAAALVLITGTTVGLALAYPQREKPTKVMVDSITYTSPPLSVPEMVRATDAVVFGRILGGVSQDIGYFRKGEPGITTSYRFHVYEVLATQGERSVDPNELTILRDGGSIDRGDRIDKVEDVDFPQFELGHEYIIFLRWNTEHEMWVSNWGPNGTFEVKAGRITSLGIVTICKKQNGLALDEFLSTLRRQR
jgi:hypothetical protein